MAHLWRPLVAAVLEVDMPNLLNPTSEWRPMAVRFGGSAETSELLRELLVLNDEQSRPKTRST
jgi:hypothetical protein